MCKKFISKFKRTIKILSLSFIHCDSVIFFENLTNEFLHIKWVVLYHLLINNSITTILSIYVVDFYYNIMLVLKNRKKTDNKLSLRQILINLYEIKIDFYVTLGLMSHYQIDIYLLYLRFV